MAGDGQAVDSEESLRLWLEGRPREAAIAIAARIALRMMPVLRKLPIQRNVAEWRERAAILPQLRCSVAAVVAAVRPTAAVTGAAATAFTIADPYGSASSFAACAASDVDTASAATSVAGIAAGHFETPARAFWEAISADAEAVDAGGTAGALLGRPLWPGHAPVPDGLEEFASGGFVAAHGLDFAFWDRMFEGFLRGQPPDWDVLEAVALLPDEVWDTDPGPLARKIAEIEARFTLLRRISELERKLAGSDAVRFAIGGNSPPQEFRIETAPAEVAPIAEPVAILRAEAVAEKPDAARIGRAIDKLGSLLWEAKAWLGGKVDLLLDESMKSIGRMAGVTLFVYALGLDPEIVKVIEAAKNWIELLK